MVVGNITVLLTTGNITSGTNSNELEDSKRIIEDFSNYETDKYLKDYDADMDQLVEFDKHCKNLVPIVNVLKPMEEELFELKAKLAAAEGAKVAATMKVELLENDSLEKTILIDYFQLELKEAKEILNFDMELMEKVIYDNNNYNMSIEAEAKYKEEELRIARRNVDDLHLRVGTITSEMWCLRDETLRSTERELEKTMLSDYFQLELKKAKQLLVNISTEAESKRTEEIQIPREAETLRTELELQAEVAKLNSELHKGRARIAAAEAAEARALSVKYGLHLAVQELAVELEAAKKNLQIVKTESDSDITISLEEYESLCRKAEMTDKTEDYSLPKTESEDVKLLKDGMENELNFGITISLEEYESLCRKAEMMVKIVDSPPQFLNSRNPEDVKILKDEAENEFGSGMITISLEEYNSLCQKAEMINKFADSSPRNESQFLNSRNPEYVKILKDEFGSSMVTILSEEYESLYRKAEMVHKLAEFSPTNESQLLNSGNSQDVKILKDDTENEFGSGITITLEEYESLCRKAEMVDKNASQYLNSEKSQDVKILRDEVENELRSDFATISLQEYKSLCLKAETANEYQIISSVNSQEVKILQEELEIANAEIDALRFSVEEAVRRAEKAEEAKAAVEEQLRRWRQKQMERRAASQQHQESKRRGLLPEENYVNQTNVRNNSVQNVKVLNYVPLGKVLNMKF